MGENERIMVRQEGADFPRRGSEMIREFVIENFMFGEGDGLEESTSFQGSGIIDSEGILELVNFIEQRFSITVKDEELVPENLDSIQKVSWFLGRKCQLDGQL